MSIQQAKALLRQQARARLAAITPDQRSRRSLDAVERLLALPAAASARTLMAYWPLPDEPDVLILCRRWLQSGRPLAAPRVDWASRAITPAWTASLDTGWETTRAGVRQPDSEAPHAPLADIDILLVPGLAFDADGRRLGRGAGFYDRLLGGCSAPKPLLVALAFEEQIVDRVPTEPHDATMDAVVTDARVFLPAVPTPGDAGHAGDPRGPRAPGRKEPT